jgi:multisubunit Na+/H+ antiporter MnhC subunit
MPHEVALLDNYLIVGAMLFGIGMIGFLSRRNMIVMFLSVEIMLQGVSLSLVAWSRFHNDFGGQMLDYHRGGGGQIVGWSTQTAQATRYRRLATARNQSTAVSALPPSETRPEAFARPPAQPETRRKIEYRPEYNPSRT